MQNDDTKDVCNKANKATHSLENVLNEVKKDWATYEADLLYKKVYKKYGRTDSPVPLKYDKILESRNYASPVEPKRPSHLLICDDLQGTSLYSNGRDNLMNHVAIKSRHIPLTVCYLVQSWTGLPRVIRLNATQFMIYKTGDKKQLRQIYEHFGTNVDEATFNRVYEYAVSQPHGFLYIDTEPKKEYMRFRVGFNDFIKI